VVNSPTLFETGGGETETTNLENKPMQSIIVTNRAGTHILVKSAKRLEGQGRRLWITDISEQSRKQIVMALAKSSLDFIQSAQESPCLAELRDAVVKKNEQAAGELDLLGEYEHVLHCMTN